MYLILDIMSNKLAIRQMDKLNKLVWVWIVWCKGVHRLRSAHSWRNSLLQFIKYAVNTSLTSYVLPVCHTGTQNHSLCLPVHSSSPLLPCSYPYYRLDSACTYSTLSINIYFRNVNEKSFFMCGQKVTVIWSTAEWMVMPAWETALANSHTPSSYISLSLSLTKFARTFIHNHVVWGHALHSLENKAI